MESTPDILLIQKLVLLLDDFHYNHLHQHLADVKAALPLKLIEVIRKKLPAFDSADELCRKVYGAAAKNDKQNFNQLNSHTFRLSKHLASNYPTYLQCNLAKIEDEIAAGKLAEANFLLACLLDISEKTCDFTSQIFALKIMSQQSYMAKDALRTLKNDSRLAQANEYQQLFYTLRAKINDAVHASLERKTDKEIETLTDYFAQYQQHACASIRILSRFGSFQVLRNLTTEMYKPRHEQDVAALRKELQNNPHVVFPFMMDIEGEFETLLLNSPYTNVFAKETARELNRLATHYDDIMFWNSYLNIGELSLITVEGTKFLSLYHNKLHHTNYEQLLDENDKIRIDDLSKRCEKIIERLNGQERNIYEERSARMLGGVLTMLKGGENIKKGVDNLESLLIDFQQINLKSSTDSIFMCLMVGYFSIKNYDKCSQTLKRYLKSIKGKLPFEGNHVKIYAYYYLSQWLSSHSKQYPAKLKALLDKHGADGSQRTIWELVEFFDLPIKATNPKETKAPLSVTSN